MAHYLMAVHGPAEMEKFGNYGSKEEMEEAFAATGAFNDQLKADGYWVFAGGLEPVATATVVDGRGDAPVLTDGPYLEAKEALGGFWVIDRIRREQKRDAKYRDATYEAAMMLNDNVIPEPTGPVEDDRLRLIFTCCHPALAPEARIALTLRLLGGLTVGEIAEAFLVPEKTMAQRITRAKKKIAAAGVPYRVPEAADLPTRLDAVSTVLFLVFNEGYLASGEGEPIRAELTSEAIRLTRILRQLLPDEPEVVGLLALQLLTEARSAARIRDGRLVVLADQDRRAWDRSLIAEGHALVRECLVRNRLIRNRPGRYQLLAAINAVHTDAPTAAATDWSQVVALYDRLIRIDPSPIVALNRAVAVAEVDGPAVALALIEGLPLTGYHAWHSSRADLLRRLDRPEEAATAYATALSLTRNSAERAYLTDRRDGCGFRSTEQPRR